MTEVHDKLAWVDAKMQALSVNKDYAKLDNWGKIQLRHEIFTKQLLPILQQAKMPIDEKTWLLGTTDENLGMVDPSLQFRSKGKDIAIQTVGQGVSGALDLTIAGVQFGHRQFMKYYTGLLDPSNKGVIGRLLGGGPTVRDLDAHDRAMQAGQDSFVNKQLTKLENYLGSGLDFTNMFLQTHRPQSTIAGLGGMSGNVVATLLFYMTLGEVTGVGTLTEGLRTSTAGRILASQLHGAADGFLMSKVIRGQSTREALAESGSWGLTATGLGITGEGVASGVGASLRGARAVKEWSAPIIRAGGMQLLGSLTDGALDRIFNEGLNINIVPFKGETPESARPFDYSTRKIYEINPYDISRPEHLGAEGVADMPHPEVENKGHLVYNNEYYPYRNTRELRLQYDRITGKIRAAESRIDPLAAKLVDAEEKALRDISEERFGTRDTASLSKEQQHELVAERTELSHEAAAEAPSLMKDEVVKEQKELLDENHKTNLVAAKYAKIFADKGIDTSKVSAESIIHQNEKLNGVNDPNEVAEKVAATITRPGRRTSQDIVASHNLQDALGPEAYAKLKKGGLEPINRMRNMSENSKAYMRNKGPRLASDGTLVGGRDKRPWNERLKDENADQLNETLKIMDGNLINFENRVHRFLFHWGNRKTWNMTENGPAMQDKIFNTLKNEFGTEFKYKDFDKFSDYLGQHLISLAKTGNLIGSKNPGEAAFVFRSTNLMGSPTKWQLELNNDLAQAEIDHLDHLLKYHPQVRAIMRVGLEFLQNKRVKTYNPNEWLEYDKAITSYMTGQEIANKKISKELAERGF